MDTGLFVSGAMDGVVKLWDTNTLEVVLEFDFQEKVLLFLRLIIYLYFFSIFFSTSVVRST